jgi:flagellin
MADEMVQYSNNNILLQAGQSMLAQANQSNQGVLTLLQG